MRMFRIIVLVVICSAILFSCRKERSFESGNGLVPLTQQWQFEEGGNAFAGPMDTAFVRAIGVASSLSLSGTSTDGTGNISLQLITTGAIAVGTYTNPQVLFQYVVNGSSVFQNSPNQADEFSITITSIDSISVTGTFSGTVTDASGANQTLTKGKFVAPLSVSTDLPEGSGRLTVWSKELCDGTGAITVKIGDSTGQITQALNAEPTCGAEGTATFILPAGAYSVTAYCGADSLVLDASVLPNVCSTLQVDFAGDPNADYFPLTSKWTYGNYSDYDNDTMSISSIGDTTIGGTDYKIFYDESSGEEHYYRKANGDYYEYVVRAFGRDLLSPAEINFLKDYKAKGDYWDSNTYSVDFGSTGVSHVETVLVRNRITNRDFSRKIGNRTYNHLIEVNTEMYGVDGSGSLGTPISVTITDYAKGVGVVQFQDLGFGVSWVLRYFNVSF